ncbi:hypothetical protein FA15DRAFT_415646 [Coprinopsis marcescibilis]|uniref:Uncharacterized protein n=1 Tax=Coprinopsis marcescibilis TaxID=230819 RepID=A0A5C3KVK2_COPMA|nr:hypothetical protein FA15DRAFT_415646 [Coprinopsis marcescibilis]
MGSNIGPAPRQCLRRLGEMETMAMYSPACRLPDELWHLIASQLTRNSLNNHFPVELIAVNRPLLTFYLSLVYSNVCWSRLDKGVIRQLISLQSPVPAGHVKRLRIHAWFIDSIRAQDGSSADRTRDTLWKLASSFITKLFAKNTAHGVPITATLETIGAQYDKVFSQTSSSNRKSISSKRFSFPRAIFPNEVIITAMMTAMQHMHNLTTYSFELRHLPLTNSNMRLLRAARTSFAGNLRRLVLHTTIRRLASVVAQADFEFLDQLELHFDYDVTVGQHAIGISSTDDAKDQEHIETELYHLQTHVLPFINALRSNLHELAISSTSTVDLTALFQGLDTFPNLRSLVLNIYFDESHLSDAQPLVHFLTAHKTTLLHLEFKPVTPPSTGATAGATFYGNNRSNPPSTRPDNAPLAEVAEGRRRQSWARIQTLLLAPANEGLLRNLESLTVPVSLLHTRNVDDSTGSTHGNPTSASASMPSNVTPTLWQTISLIKRSLPSLTSLAILDRKLSYAELIHVLDIFSDKPFQLKTLYIEVLVMDSMLLKALATRLLGLKNLVVVHAAGGLDVVSAHSSFACRAVQCIWLPATYAHVDHYESPHELVY